MTTTAPFNKRTRWHGDRDGYPEVIGASKAGGYLGEVRAYGSLAASWFALPGFETRRDPDADPYDKSGNVKR